MWCTPLLSFSFHFFPYFSLLLSFFISYFFPSFFLCFLHSFVLAFLPSFLSFFFLSLFPFFLRLPKNRVNYLRIDPPIFILSILSVSSSLSIHLPNSWRINRPIFWRYFMSHPKLTVQSASRCLTPQTTFSATLPIPPPSFFAVFPDSPPYPTPAIVPPPQKRRRSPPSMGVTRQPPSLAATVLG